MEFKTVVKFDRFSTIYHREPTMLLFLSSVYIFFKLFALISITALCITVWYKIIDFRKQGMEKDKN